MRLRLLIIFISLSTKCFAQTNEIIFSEIFADPTPSKGLPEREFLEIFNNSNKDIRLKGFKLFYGSSEANFPDSVLKSNSYGIVCRKGYEKEFSNYGNVIPVNNFSLTNDGSLLILKNEKAQDVFAINYSSEWYTKGRDQGISLEMIDLNFPCKWEGNWASSQAEKGATPGSVNSVNSSKPDVLGPHILSSSLDLNQIILSFDENLKMDFPKNKNNFSIKNGDNKVLEINFNNYKPSEIVLDLSNKLEEGEQLDLEIKNIEDCSGNFSKDTVLSFFNFSPPDSSEIQISEILFNPKIGGVDFLEVFNNSEKIINLKNWKIANIDSKGEIANISELSQFDLLLHPAEYLAFTVNKEALFANYPQSNLRNIVELKGMPSFNDDSGTAILFDPSSKEFDRFKYSEKMHNAVIANPEGVSLEKSKFKEIKRNENVWLSAAADIGFATPGYKNSCEDIESLKNHFFVEPIVFNPHQENDKMITFLNYDLNEPGAFASVEILDRNGHPKRHLKSNFSLSTNGKIEWDGKDDSGNILPVGYYVFKVNFYSKKSNETFLIKTVIGSF